MSNGWPLVPLGEILTKSEEWIDLDPNKEYRQVTVRMWGKGLVERARVSGSEIAAPRQLVVRAGQFMLSRIDARHGALGLVPETLDGAVVSNDFPAFCLNQDRIVPGFMEWLSKTSGFVDLCRAASEGTTNRVRLKEDRFLAMTIPLPPLAEQRRIVARIEALAARIEAARILRQEAVEETNKLYAAALSLSVEPHGAGWQRQKVEDVIISMDAGWSPLCEDRAARGDEWSVLKTTSVQWSEFRPYENKVLPTSLVPRPELCVQIGDVLVTRAGPRKRVAVVAAVRDAPARLTISDKLIRLRPDLSKIDPRFLEISLASPFSQEYLVQRKTGLADAQVNISQAILRATPIAYPPLPEQRRIVAHLDALQARVAALQAHQAATAAELDALLPAILDRAFKGKL